MAPMLLRSVSYNARHLHFPARSAARPAPPLSATVSLSTTPHGLWSTSVQGGHNTTA